MRSNGILRYLKTKHPNPLRSTPPTKKQIKDELSGYEINFADERRRPPANADELVVIQIKHYTRIIEFQRYADILDKNTPDLEASIKRWTRKVEGINSPGNSQETRLARMNSNLWTSIPNHENDDSIYQAGFESYRLARQIVEKAKGTGAQTASTDTIEKLVKKLDFQQMLQYPLDSSIKFQRDALLEQRRYVCRELTKGHESFAIIEAGLLKGFAKRAYDKDMLDFAREVLSPEIRTPGTYRKKQFVRLINGNKLFLNQPAPKKAYRRRY